MKNFLTVLFVVVTIPAFAEFQAIIFSSNSAALEFAISIEDRIPHQPGWQYCDHASPTIRLTDGRLAMVISPAGMAVLTAEEKNSVQILDDSLIPPIDPIGSQP